MKIHTFYLGFLILLTSNLFSQENDFYRKYLTQQKNHELNSNDLEYKDRRNKIEEYVSAYENENNNNLINIPIYFQILYAGSESSIKLEELESQIVTLNNYFNGENPIITDSINIHQQKFLELKASPNINFCFSEENVNFKQVDSAFEENLWNIMDGELGGSNPILPEKYINIYIVDLNDNHAGFAQQPWTSTKYNGIVLNTKFLKQKHTSEKFNSGKTLVHLMGSYLGLLELWDEYKLCEDDKVEDTPIHDAPSSTIYNRETRHISFCGHNLTSMTINLMDNTDDSELFLFSLGQTKRISAMLSENGPRGNLATTECDNQIAESREKNIYKVNILPNPSSGNWSLIIYSKKESYSKIRILNIDGKNVLTKKLRLNKGQNEFPFFSNDLDKGYYLLEVEFDDNSKQIKNLIIQN